MTICTQSTDLRTEQRREPEARSLDPLEPDRTSAVPLIGIGRSLNVAVAGSLVFYKLAGLS